MGNMAQELMALGFQPCQTFRKPDNALANGAQLARAFKGDRIPERLPLAQAVNHALDTLHRADDHAGKEQNQTEADEEQHQRLPAKELATFRNLLLQLLPA